MHSRTQSMTTNVSSLVVLFAAFFLAGCEGSSTDRQLPTPLTDTESPHVVRITPESEINGYEVDFQPTVLFSEVVNVDSVFDGGVKILSGRNDLGSEGRLIERPVSVEHQVVPGEEKVPDVVSGKLTNVDASFLNISLEGGRFALNNVYTLVVEGTIRDLVEDDLSTSEDERNFVNSQYSTIFTTEPGAWHSAETLTFKYLSEEADSSSVLKGQSLDSVFRSTEGGNIVAVWRQLVDGQVQLWASQYLAELNSWVLPGATGVSAICQKNPDSTDPSCANSVRLDSNLSTDVFNPNLALNNSGNIVVTWSQAKEVGSADSIWVNKFELGEWAGATDILFGAFATDKPNVYPVVTLAENNHVIMAWVEKGVVEEGDSIRTSKFKLRDSEDDPSYGYGTPIHISNPPSGSDSVGPEFGQASYLNLVSNKLGHGIVIWSQLVDGVERVLSNEIISTEIDDTKGGFEVDIGENQFIDLPSGVSHRAISPKAAISDSGDISVIWRQSEGSVLDLLYSRNVGGKWEKPEKLEYDDTGDVNELNLSYSSLNELLVTWSSAPREEGEGHSLFVTSFHRVDGWSKPELLASGNGVQVSDLNVSYDLEGNASVVWVQRDLRFARVISKQYSKLSEVWLGAEDLYAGALVNDLNSLVLQPIKLDGRMLSIWINYSDSGSSIMSSIFKESIKSY